jgi:hypothetical protein
MIKTGTGRSTAPPPIGLRGKQVWTKQGFQHGYIQIFLWLICPGTDEPVNWRLRQPIPARLSDDSRDPSWPATEPAIYRSTVLEKMTGSAAGHDVVGTSFVKRAGINRHENLCVSVIIGVYLC